VTASNILAGRIAAYTKHGGSDDPRIPDVRRELATTNIAAYIEVEVAKAPPLREEQIDRLTALLRRDAA
jgi:hypothetical protein